MWAHVAEFGDYWLDACESLLASPDEAPPFGRVKSDPHRIAAIEAGAAVPISEHLATVRAAIARCRRFIEGLDDAGWARTATHRTLGVLTMERILEGFLVGHYEEHASQLESLRA